MGLHVSTKGPFAALHPLRCGVWQGVWHPVCCGEQQGGATMEVIGGRGGTRCSIVFIQLQIRLTVFVFWIMLVHPNAALYLDFYANNPLERESPDAPRNGEGHETLSWAVKIQHQSHRKSVNRTHVDFLADVIADDLRLKNYGQVGELIGHYLFVADSYHEALNGSMNWDLVGKIRSKTEGALARHPMIEWFNQQTIRRRFKRALHFSDPSYKNQWHLVGIADVQSFAGLKDLHFFIFFY